MEIFEKSKQIKVLLRSQSVSPFLPARPIHYHLICPSFLGLIDILSFLFSPPLSSPCYPLPPLRFCPSLSPSLPPCLLPTPRLCPHLYLPFSSTIKTSLFIRPCNTSTVSPLSYFELHFIPSCFFLNGI